MFTENIRYEGPFIRWRYCIALGKSTTVRENNDPILFRDDRFAHFCVSTALYTDKHCYIVLAIIQSLKIINDTGLIDCIVQFPEWPSRHGRWLENENIKIVSKRCTIVIYHRNHINWIRASFLWPLFDSGVL